MLCNALTIFDDLERTAPTVSATQIKAARAILNWSQDDLAAAANLSRTTIRSVETGCAVRAGNINEIHKAFEKNGIEFLDDEGVKRQPEYMRTYSGPNSCDRFFHDLIKTVKEKSGDVMCHIESQDMLLKLCGTPRRNNLERLEQVQEVADVKCLLSNAVKPPVSLPSFQIRVMPQAQTFLPSSCFVYDDQWVFANQDNRMEFLFIVFQKPAFVHRCKNAFLPLWHIAEPELVETGPQKRRA